MKNSKTTSKPNFEIKESTKTKKGTEIEENTPLTEMEGIEMEEFTPSVPHVAVVLVNLGTPDEPTASAVSRYLKQFLSDRRVIEIPMVIWQVILRLFVLTARSPKVAIAYQSIWQEDSPIRQISEQQARELNKRWADMFDDCNLSVHSAMTYGNPSIASVFDNLQLHGVEHIVVVPMFPQYSSTSTGAVYDAVSRWSYGRRQLPNISINKDYYDHPLYIKALANSVRRFQREHGKPDKLLMSFHGIPKPYEDKGDDYPSRCRCTAELLAKALNLTDNEWLCSFQSRFGLQEWVKPYTDETLIAWGKEGVESVQVISPAFSADCLETLEELAILNRENFIDAGGKEYAYIPALNADKQHIDLLEDLTLPLVEGWVRSHRK